MNKAEKNAETVRRGYEAFNSGVMMTLTEIFHESASWHTRGTYLGALAFSLFLILTLSLVLLRAAWAADTWTATGSLITGGRSQHTATLLVNGKVLVAGGRVSVSVATTASWTAPSSTTRPRGPGPPPAPSPRARHFHTATLLPNGQVLVAGGYNRASGYLDSAELYDPATGTWTATGSMATARLLAHRHPAAQRPGPGGRGLELPAPLDQRRALRPWHREPGPPPAPWSLRVQHHTATLLPNGQVLVAGAMVRRRT